MTFNVLLKNEILENRPLRARHKKAYAYGLLLFAQSFGGEMRLSTEHKGIAHLYASAATGLVGISGSVTTYTRVQAGKTVYDVQVDSVQDALAIAASFGDGGEGIRTDVFKTDEDRGAFCAGAFLACGSMIDPQNSYHLEFVLPRPALAEPFSALLAEMGYPPKRTTRRDQQVLYFRDSEQIEGMLAVMGATRITLELMNLKIYKDIRNKANRQSNCDTANIDKAVSAGGRQVEDIQCIGRQMGLERLDDDLRELAELRLQNPEATLRELGEMMNPPLTRSGVNHRFVRLGQLAQECREAAGKENHG